MGLLGNRGPSRAECWYEIVDFRAASNVIGAYMLRAKADIPCQGMRSTCERVALMFSLEDLLGTVLTDLGVIVQPFSGGGVHVGPPKG